MNQAPPPLSPAQPQPSVHHSNRSSRPGLVIYAVIVTGALCVSIVFNLMLGGLALFRTPEAQSGLSVQSIEFAEELIAGNPHADDKIAVIGIDGVIAAMGDGISIPDSIVGLVQAQLKAALEDGDVQAIIIRINSPGGEVVASDMIYRAVHAADQVKPVVAAIDAVGASGAYYVAVGARHIVANEMSITGSIGVIMQTFSAADLAEKIGLKFHTFKSGKYKDLLNPARDPEPEEMALVNTLIMDIYHQFVGIVAEERDLELEALKGGDADGRILSGRQALQAGLVDEVGQFEDAIAQAMDFAGIEEARVVRYQAPFTFRDILRIFASAKTPSLQLNLLPSRLSLQPGHFYFLPPHLFE